MEMNKASIFLLLPLVVSAITIGQINQGLDPGQISWWLQTWNEAPIVLDSNEPGSRTLTFNFRLTHSISDGVVEFICPNSGCSNTLTGQTIEADEDVSASFTTTLSSTGTYGPYGILTRNSANGAIVDANYQFGTIGVTEAASTGSLTVSSTSSTAEIGSQVDLNFSFTLGVDLWKYDVVVLDISQHYTASSRPVCTLVGETEAVVGANGDTDLACAKDDDGNIVIYGISNDVTGSSINFSVDVTGFELPEFIQNSFQWTATIYRFGTHTVLAEYSGSANPVTLTAGSVGSISWTPFFDYSAERLNSGINLFMQLSFSTSHSIPASGKIDIQFSNASPTVQWYSGSSNFCVVSSHISEATCSVSGVTITLTIGVSQVQAGSFIVVTRNSFSSSSAGISSITSQTSSSQVIDQNSATEIQITYAQEVPHSTASFEVQVNDGTLNSNSGLGGYSSNTLMFVLYGASNVGTFVAGDGTNGDHFQFSCPFISSTWDFESLYISNDATFTTGVSDGVTTAGDPSTAVLSSDSITMDGLNIDQATPTTQDFILAASLEIVAPLVVSNYLTMYQCWFVSTSLAAGETDGYKVGASLLNIAGLTQPTVLDVGPVCLDATIPTPLLLRISDNNVQFNFASQEFEIKLTSGSSYDIGLTSGEIPYYSSQTLTAQALSSTEYKLTDLSVLLETGSELLIYLPNNLVLANSVTNDITVKIQYLNTRYTGLQIYNEIFEKTIITTGATSGGAGSVSISEPAEAISPSTSTSYVFSYQPQSDPAIQGYFGIIGASGFSLESTTIATGFNEPIILTSSDNDFTANAILALQSSSTTIQSSGGTTITLEGLSSLDHQGSMDFYLFDGKQHDDSGSNPLGYPDGSACLTMSMVQTVTVTSPVMVDPTATATNCQIRGANNIQASLVISQTLTHPIPQDGTYVIEILEFEASSLSVCTSTKGVCAFSFQTVTVTATPDVITNGILSITITDLLAPSSGTPGTSVNLINQSYSQDENGNPVQLTNSANGPFASCSISAAGDNGTVNLSQATTYPNGAGLSDLDLYFQFSLSKDLPSGSTIEISTESDLGELFSGQSGNVQDSCWSSLLYSDCSISSSTLILTLQEDYQLGETIELYLDSAISLSSGEGTRESVISIVSKWEGVTVSQTTTSQDFSVFQEPQATLTPHTTALDIDYYTAAEYATYVFNFTLDVSFDDEHQIWIKFPKDFDSYIGDVWTKAQDCFQNYFFMTCSSETLGTEIQCNVDHWWLIVSGIQEVAAEDYIDITIQNVLNPQAGTSKAIQIYVVDTFTSTVHAADQSYATVTTTSLPQNLQLKEINSYSEFLGGTSDYTLSFFTSETLDQTIQLGVRFPMQFNLQETQGTDTLSCSSLYYDQSGTTDDQNQGIEWTTTSSCSLKGNTVFFSIQAQQSLLGALTNRVTITINQVNNPDWGFIRTPSDSDFYYDDEDSEIFPVYDYWANKMQILIFDTASNAVIFKSLDNLNGVFAGYQQLYPGEMTINQFQPATLDNSIKIYAGSQSGDISVSVKDWPMSIDKVTLTPSMNEIDSSLGVSFSSWKHSFIVHQWVSDINVRVSAPLNTATGLYYIDWTHEQTKKDYYTENQYNSPARTLLQICDQDQSINIEIDDIPSPLYIGYPSIPIKVTLQNAPATDMSIAFTSSSQKVTINPDSLEFSPDIDTLYFEIYVVSTFDSNTDGTPVISLDIRGSDEQAYIQPSGITLSNIQQGGSDIEDQAEISSISASSTGSNSGRVSVSASEDGVVYWWLGCQGSQMTYEDILRGTGSIVDWTGHSSIQNQLKTEYTTTRVNPQGDESIQDYFWVRYNYHCSIPYYSAESVQSGQSTVIEFDFLHDETTYIFGAYIHNLRSQNVSDARTAQFTTSSKPDLYTLTLSVAGDVAENDIEDIRDLIAKSIRINSDWLQNGVLEQESSQEGVVSSSEITWNILYSDTYSSITPQLISAADGYDEALEEIATYLQLNTTDLSFSTSSLQASTSNSFSGTPSVSTSEESAIIFSLTTSTDGWVAVSCLEGQVEDSVPSSKQVFFGLTQDSDVMDGWQTGYATAGAATSLRVEGLAEQTIHTCYVVACGDHRLWPTCGTVSTVEGSTIKPNDLNTGVLMGVGLIFFMMI